MPTWVRRRLTRTLAGIGALLLAASATAEPTVGELRQVCTVALEAGYRGVEAAACDWYLEPCTVCGAEPAPPQWCLPEALDAAARARLLLAVLPRERQHDAQPAAPVIAAILRDAYPCPAAGPSDGVP